MIPKQYLSSGGNIISQVDIAYRANDSNIDEKVKLVNSVATDDSPLQQRQYQQGW